MHALVIAVGNLLRADDGVAHRALDLLEPFPDVTFLRLHQLTPEVASEMRNAETVVFLDADPSAEAAALEPVHQQVERSSPLSHWTSPSSLVLLARKLYEFRGEAWLCRLPARDFTPAGAITAEAEAEAAIAARLVRELLESRCMSPR